MGIYQWSQNLLTKICSTNLSIDVVSKSFNEVTWFSIRECVQCALKFNPDLPETGKKLFSSNENVVGTLLDNI